MCSVCNVPVFACAYRPWGHKTGSAGRFGEREGWRNVGRYFGRPQLPRPQGPKASNRPLAKYPSTAPSTCSKIGKLGPLPHLVLTCPPALPTELQLRDPVPRCWSRFGAFAFGSGDMAPHMWSPLLCPSGLRSPGPRPGNRWYPDQA